MPLSLPEGPIESRPAASGAHQLADWIRERIRLGQFVPGQRLVEADIVSATGAKRSKVREALQRLETEGLIAIEEFRGASVKKLSWDEVRQIYRARMALEGLAAREFAAADAPALKTELQRLQTEMNAWEHTGDHERYGRLNSAWHGLIIDGAGNGYVKMFLARLTVPIYRLLFSTFYRTPRIEAANADHRAITSAICEGRVDDAEQAMRRHIEDGLTALSEIDPAFFS